MKQEQVFQIKPVKLTSTNSQRLPNGIYSTTFQTWEILEILSWVKDKSVQLVPVETDKSAYENKAIPLKY